ncbi:MAG: histidine phosphatase family protein [Lysinibacillus sp.]|nr:histidine phosphatase family protein [Lysinibacillus sp.]
MENKLQLYFVRHGETEWNKEGRLQGWLDSPLTTRGITQIAQLKKQLQRVRFSAVYASPANRAYQSAILLVGHNLKIQRDERLQEIHLGSWQGRRIEDIEKEDYARYNQYIDRPAEYTPDTGESFQQVMERMNEFFNDCIANHQSGNILIISHGVAIRAFILSLLNLPIETIWDYEIDGASVTKITVVEGKIKVDYIGETLLPSSK